MALVILPCDLPYWYLLEKQLILLKAANNAKLLVNGMLKIHDLCNNNTGLDPDEPQTLDPKIFAPLETFLMSFSAGESSKFYRKILPAMIKRALNLKSQKPVNGFHFSLQQQGDETAYKRSFLASLLAHSFFSTFPKRTEKTHPTLQNFNFSFFFKFLDQPWQQAKLKSVFHYFELLENTIDDKDVVIYSRQVMTGKQWLTINDWTENCSPLCPIAVRNEGFLDDAEPQCFRICFSSSKIGGSVLGEGKSQESIEFCTIPELICILASVEALEDNEVFLVNDAYQVSKIEQLKDKVTLEKYEKPIRVNLCCMDAGNYSTIPESQLDEDNVLRELNKALLGFQQGKSRETRTRNNPKSIAQKRLPPIGESFSSPSHESHLSKENNRCAGLSSSSQMNSIRRNFSPKTLAAVNRKNDLDNDNLRGRFIVLGSSGECLPVNRSILPVSERLKSSFENNSSFVREEESENENESEDEDEDDDDDDDDGEIFLSAKTSLEDIKDINKDAFSDEDTSPDAESQSSSSEENMISFAERLREALLRGAKTYTTKTSDSSYAVDISVSESIDEDNNIRCKRSTSTGFILQEESQDNNLSQELERDLKSEKYHSEDYSFASDDLELEIYDKLTKWLMMGTKNSSYCLTGAEAFSDFASTLLKRALSDSYAVSNEEFRNRKQAVLLARSFSLELAKRNPRLAAHLVSFFSKKNLTLKSNLPNHIGQKPVATGNWGCGSRLSGDPQIKLTIQWLAASYTGLPNLTYYTCRHQKLVKLDTVRRVLLDRGWTVGQLTTLLLEYAEISLQTAQSSINLFDLLIKSFHE